MSVALLLNALWLSSPAHAGCTPAQKGEPVVVHVLTTSQGGKIFNSQGHTALWISGGRLEDDMVYNWGAFDGRRNDLLPAFLSGRMEFWLAAEVYEVQWKRTVRTDRTLVAQRLRLPPGEGEKIAAKLRYEAHPDRRDYVYHYHDNNCATQVRDVINDAIGGQLEPQLSDIVPWTGRYDGGRNLAPWPIVWFAWDFMVGSYLDRPITEWQAGMVPQRLMNSLEDVEYTHGWPDGRSRRLVAETCLLRKGGYSWAQDAPPSYWPISLTALALGGAAFGLGTRRHKQRWTGTVSGGLLLAPILLLAFLGTATMGIWAVSDLDGVGPSENWSVGNPLTWLLLGPIVQVIRGRVIGPWSRRFAYGLAALGVVGLVVKPLPWFDQVNVGALTVWLPLLLSIAALAWRDAVQPPKK